MTQGEVNKEPISIALADAAKRSRLPKALLLRIIQAYVASREQKQEIEYQEFPDYVAMEERSEMYRTSLLLLNLRMLRMDFKAHPQLFTAAEFAGSCG